MVDRTFYVYEHWRSDTGLPFYVGMGRGKRATPGQRRNRAHKQMVALLAKLGESVEVRRVFGGLDKETAATLERSIVNYWGSRGVELTNVPSSVRSGIMREVWSKPETFEKFRASITKPGVREGRNAKIAALYETTDLRERMRASVIAAKSSPEARARMRDAAKLGWARRKQRQSLMEH